MKHAWIIGIIMSVAVSGCGLQSNTARGGVYGTAGGAAAGALLGQVVGRNHKSTLIGTAAGAVIGGLAGTGIGYMMDKQEKDMRQALADSDSVSVQREGEMLALNFKNDVTFDVNSSEILPGLYPDLNRVAEVLNRYPDTTIQVAGHTDSSGSDALNMSLSQRRAESVRSYLIQQGIDSSRIEAVGYGKTRPIASNSTAEGRRLNRRVEIRIIPEENKNS